MGGGGVGEAGGGLGCWGRGIMAGAGGGRLLILPGVADAP